MYDISVLWQSQQLPGILILVGLFWLVVITYETVRPGGQKRGFAIAAVILVIVASLLFGVLQEVRYIRNPSIRETVFSYTSARTSVFDFGEVYVFTDENGREYDLTIYPKTAKEYLGGGSPKHNRRYQVFYEPQTMTVVGIHDIDLSAEGKVEEIQRIPVSKEEFKTSKHLYSIGKIYRSFVGGIVACLLGILITTIIAIGAETLPGRLLASGITLVILVLLGSNFTQSVNDVFHPELFWEEMYFEDFNYNGGSDHLFYTTVEYDFTTEDGERYYIDYAEGKLEEYLNVSEMNPGEKYRILYDMKSGLVLDVQTTERK